MSAPQTLPPRTASARPVAAFIGLWLMFLLGIAQAAAPTISSVQFRVDEHLLRVALQAEGTLPTPTVEVLADPPRLILDYPGVTVRYNEGNPRVFPIHLESVTSLKVLQQSTQPPVGRLVLVFDKAIDPASLQDRLVLPTAGGQVIVADTPLSAAARENLTAGRPIDAYDATPVATPTGPATITKLVHERFGADHDRFRFEADGPLSEPVVTLDGPRLLCRFNEARFRIPATAAKDSFNAPVEGAVVREFEIVNEANGGVLLLLTLDPPVGHTLSNEFIRLSGSQLQLDVRFSALTTPEPAPLPGLPLPPAPPAAGSGEQIAVLAGGQNAAGLTITQIQYQPTPEGERFIVIGNAPFQGELERLSYPDRQVYTVRGARVALPAGVGDRYTIPLSSDLVQDMQVVLKETAAGPEAQINWRLNTTATRDVQVSVKQVEPTLWHVDFVPAPKASVPAAPVAPEVTPVEEIPAPAPAMELPVVEDDPVVEAAPEAVVEPEPVVEVSAVAASPEPEAAPAPAAASQSESSHHTPMTLPQAPPKREQPTVETPAAPEITEPAPVEEAAVIEEPVVIEEPTPAPAIEPVVEMPESTAHVALPEPELEPTPTPVVEAPAPAIELPAAPVWGDPVSMVRQLAGNTDLFIFESNSAMRPEIVAAKFPNRLLITFEQREVNFDGLAMGKTRFFKGAVASSVRLMKGKTPEQVVVQIALDRPLEEVTYDFTVEGTRSTLRIVNNTPVEPVAPMAETPVVIEEPVAAATPVAIEEPAPVIESPAPVVEAPVAAVEEVAPAPAEVPLAKKEIFSFSLKQLPIEEFMHIAMGEILQAPYEIAPSAAGRVVSLELKGATLFQFLQAMKRENGVHYKKVDGVYRFYTLDPAPVATPPAQEPPAPLAIERPQPAPAPAPEPEPMVEIPAMQTEMPAPEPTPEVVEEAPVMEVPVVIEPELTDAERQAEKDRLAAASATPPQTDPEAFESAPTPEPAIVVEEPAPAAVEPTPAVETVRPTKSARPAPVRIEEPKADVAPAIAPTPEPAPKALDAPATPGQAAITGISHRVENGQDVFEISYTGTLGEPMVNWLNYPAQLALSFLNTQMASPDAGRQQQSAGDRFDALKLWSGGTDQEPAARVSLYLREGLKAEGLNYNISHRMPGTLLISVTGQARPVARDAGSAMDAPKADQPAPAREAVKIEDGTPTDAPAAAPATQKRTGRYFNHFDPTRSASDPVNVVDEPLVTLDLRSAAAADVISTIADSYNLSISVEPSVKQEITVKVYEKPLTIVFDLIAAQAGVKWFLSDAGIYIFASEAKLRQDYGDSFQDVVVYEPRYASATQMQQALRQLRMLDNNDVTLFRQQRAGGNAQGGVSNATEKLLIRVTPGRRDLVMRVLDEIDSAPVQVRLDVKIMRVSQTAAKRSGLDWIINNGGQEPGAVTFSLQEKAPSTSGFDPITGAPIPTRGRPDNDIIGGFERDITSSRINIQAVLNYLETNNEAVSVANPNLVVANGQTGTLFVGETVPFRSTFQVSDFGRVTQRISQQQIGLQLQFSARADLERGLVSLSVTPNLSSLIGVSDIGPRTGDNNFTINLVIPSGESFVVGGILNDSTTASENRIPFFGDLPLLGKLFKSKSKGLDRSELILVFTPTILDIYAQPMYFPPRTGSSHLPGGGH